MKMSAYTQVSFILPKDKSLKKLNRMIRDDVCTIKSKIADNGILQHVLTFHEFDLKDALPELDKLKKEFSLRFYIEHAEY
tara:strand:- start:8 stop:247 length:240 start_codon:yes stop_codon:yes gene_type:complete